MIVLVLGGARSGKSAFAERLAAGYPEPVTYVATLEVGDDTELADRVATHRQRRPAGWSTVEPGAGLPEALSRLPGTALVDSLGPWLAALPSMAADPGPLCAALTGRTGDTVVVSEEVGLGVHPSSEAGRQFRDRLGLLNQAVSAVADRVVLVVAGRGLTLHPPEET
ncbi:MAG TPA: bifunctional adenosylcobinamide kinase/adenosylcobinamide-phosphate guanylyltransferase [Acidimicrobiales bacterium]|nr:bifunctional adenosylcobinamide kinase/adenosylcobinamide-phosphate guanylyltransferase [Acidimicrobiales bacterium]